MSAPQTTEPRRWISPADWLGRIISLAFVGVAGAVAIQMAYASGGDDIRRMTMVGVVAAGLAIIAFGPGLTLGRGRYLAALFLLPVWLVVVGYNGLSALEYFDRYLSDVDARQKLKSDLYQEQRAELQRLRDRRAAIKTARPVTTIEAEVTVEARTRCLDRCLTLKAELEDARARDRLDDDIRAAAMALSGADAKGAADTSRHLEPVFHWLTTVTGVTVASAKDLRALFLLLITELGAALVPVAMAMASGRKRPRTIRQRRTVAPEPEPDIRQPSGPEREDARQIMTWMDVRTLRAPGGRTTAADLYGDYVQWMRGRDRMPVTRTRFGTVLSEDCGLAKRKAGAKWTVNYLGIELKPPGPRRGGAIAFLAFPRMAQSGGPALADGVAA